MPADFAWLKYSEGLDIELRESEEEGKCIKSFKERVNNIMRMAEGTEKEALAGPASVLLKYPSWHIVPLKLPNSYPVIL